MQKQSKSSLYALRGDSPDQPPELWSAQIDWTHQQGMAELKVKSRSGVVLEDRLPSGSRAFDRCLKLSGWQNSGAGATQLMSVIRVDMVVRVSVKYAGNP